MYLVVPIHISEKCRKNCKHCYYSEQIKFFLHVCRFFFRPKLASTYACYQVDAKYRFWRQSKKYGKNREIVISRDWYLF